jgi:hypothetical protein
MAISIRAAGRGPASRTEQQRRIAVEPLRPAETAGRVDRDYWLAHCEGYRVDGGEGRLGFVEEVRIGREHPRETILAVRAGRLGRRRLLVSAAEVAFLVPRAQRIWLRTPTTIVDTEPLQV